MLRLLLAAVLPVTFTCAWGTFSNAPARTQEVEPPLRFAIELDGVKFSAEADKKVEVEVDGKKRSLIIALEPTRHFRAAGVAFDFPREMVYSYDGEDGVDMWTLDGDMCMVMVQKIAEGEDAGALAKIVLDEVLGEHENKPGRAKSTTLKLGGKKWKAVRNSVKNGDFTERWTACGVDTKGGSLIFLFQEIIDEDNEAAAEMKAILGHLDRTFVIDG